jgi:hypothetical protein
MRRIAFILLLVAICKLPALAQDTSCVLNVPAVKLVVEHIAKQFPSWRIQTLSDFSVEYQDMWKKKHPQECPGFTSGHYLTKTKLTYAALLIPSDSRKPGYKLVLISQSRAGKTFSSVLENVNGVTSTPNVIYTLPPGKYSDAETVDKVTVHSDVLVLEQLEAGSVLYYYRNGRFKKLIISE